MKIDAGRARELAYCKTARAMSEVQFSILREITEDLMDAFRKINKCENARFRATWQKNFAGDFFSVTENLLELLDLLRQKLIAEAQGMEQDFNHLKQKNHFIATKLQGGSNDGNK